MNNILVTGAYGQLGSEIKELSAQYAYYTFFFTGSGELDICDEATVGEYIKANDIDTIINCAAYTAVDKAESEREWADKVNHIAVGYLAKIAKEKNIRLIHLSTDYVFDGKGFRPYPPGHPKNPVNVYGSTKSKGEEAVKALDPDNSLIIRTSWVYSSYGNNFVKTMLRLGKEREEINVINDQVGAPTYAGDLAAFILENALNVKYKGVKIYHYTNEGVCSWYDFAREIMDLAKLNCKVNAISTSDYPTPAKRPFYSIMDKTILKQDFGVEIPYWKESLKVCLEKISDSFSEFKNRQ